MHNRSKGAFLYTTDYMKYLIPQGYVKGHSIYQQYVEETHDPQDAVQENNDSSYVLRRCNMSLSYHSNYKKN